MLLVVYSNRMRRCDRCEQWNEPLIKNRVCWPMTTQVKLHMESGRSMRLPSQQTCLMSTITVIQMCVFVCVCVCVCAVWRVETVGCFMMHTVFWHLSGSCWLPFPQREILIIMAVKASRSSFLNTLTEQTHAEVDSHVYAEARVVF